MSHRGAINSVPSANILRAPTTPTNLPSSVDPPPDYSTCVSNPERENSNNRSRTIDTTHSHPWHPILKDEASGLLVTGHMLPNVATSAPFNDATPTSENRHDGYFPASNPYNPQPPYNPSYMANRSITPRPNVYGRKTIVLMRTDAQNSARKRKITLALCVGLTIGCIIPIVTIVCIFKATSRHSTSRTIMNDYIHKPTNVWQNDGVIFNTRLDPTANPYLIDTYKINYDDNYGRIEKSDTPSNPLFDDKYKGTVYEKPKKEMTEEDILREMGINVPDLTKIYENALSAGQNIDNDFRDPVIKPITMSDEMKDLLGLPRDENKNEKKPPKWK